ncbi:hypothetical protein EJB05_04597, partial [Eragrostis curvula]
MRSMPRISDAEANSLAKVLVDLQYLTGCIAVCFLERKYSLVRGGQDVNPLFGLVELGVVFFGGMGFGASMLYLYYDAIDSPNARLPLRPRRI